MAPTSRGSCVEVLGCDELTLATAPRLVDALTLALRQRPAELWLNLEAAKIVDVVGMAVLAQTVERAAQRGTRATIFPSAVLYRSLAQVGLLDRLPLDKRRAAQRDRSDCVIEPEAMMAPLHLATVSGVRLVPPTWDDLPWLERWACDEALAERVGSELLQHCRHFGAYDPEVATACLTAPTAQMFLVHPAGAATAPLGFVRLFGVNLGQRFAFLETAIAPTRQKRTAWGIEASRLMSRFALDVLGLYRIETKVYADNVLCINALRRHGFTEEGRLREACGEHGRRSDILVFGILEAQIRAGLTNDIPSLGFWDREPA